MAEHWCKEHRTVWFKRGGMKGYAHPITDEEGEPTGEWCNEPKTEGSKSPTRQFGDSPEKIASIEAQKRADIIAQIWIAGKFSDDSPEVTKMREWLMGKSPKTKEPPKPVKEETTQQTDTSQNGEEVKTLGDLFNACHKSFNLQTNQVLELLGVGSKTEIADVKEAWQKIKEKKSENPPSQT